MTPGKQKKLVYQTLDRLKDNYVPPDVREGGVAVSLDNSKNASGYSDPSLMVIVRDGMKKVVLSIPFLAACA